MALSKLCKSPDDLDTGEKVALVFVCFLFIYFKNL